MSNNTIENYNELQWRYRHYGYDIGTIVLQSMVFIVDYSLPIVPISLLYCGNIVPIVSIHCLQSLQLTIVPIVSISLRYCGDIAPIVSIVIKVDYSAYNEDRQCLDSMGAILPRYCHNIGTIVYYNEYKQGIHTIGAILPRYCYNIGTIGTIVYL